MSDLQQAVERYGRYKREIMQGTIVDCQRVDDEGVEEARDLLADAYLSQHAAPGDDGEAVTEEWVRSVGFTADSEPIQPGKLLWNIGYLVYRPHYFGEGMPRWQYGPSYIQNQKTRGDVRRLCAALGIPLK